ncbi:MAG TPA: class I SAM-dependent methyltransferase [Solirubrobacterales bacterium]
MIAVREEAVWHDVECGAYGADLGLWTELASIAAWGGERRAEVLEIGCGTGRVALHLARRGHCVTGVDLDPVLIEALAERARAAGLAVDAVATDARELDLDRRFGLVAAPMQVIQLLGEPGRARALAGIAAHLAPGGLAAFAILDGPAEPWRASPGAAAPAPDVRERDGGVCSSLPLAIEPEGGVIAVRRLRQIVSPAGQLSEAEDVVRLHELAPGQLERQGEAAGLRPRERRRIAPTDDHLGSVVVVFEGAG